MNYESFSPNDTKRLGEKIAALLQPGDVILLQGDLGAGKTCLAQGIGKGLRVKETVKSSSFVLVNEYHGRLHVFHADLFRLGDPQEVFDLGLEENAREGLLLVEWPEVAIGELPNDHLLVRLDTTGTNARRISISAVGPRYDTLIEELRQPISSGSGNTR